MKVDRIVGIGLVILIGLLVFDRYRLKADVGALRTSAESLEKTVGTLDSASRRSTAETIARANVMPISPDPRPSASAGQESQESAPHKAPNRRPPSREDQ